jgi:hypothetical protein
MGPPGTLLLYESSDAPLGGPSGRYYSQDVYGFRVLLKKSMIAL